MVAAPHALGRRAVLAGALSLLAARLPAAPAPPRLAAIDWAMLETAIAIGRTPIAACELVRYRQDVGAPRIPPDVVDLGLRGSPNFELLQLTRPDLILSSPYYTQIAPRLEGIAPVLTLPFYVPGEPPWPKAVAALHALAARLDIPQAGARAEAEAEAQLARIAARLAPLRDRPVYVVEIGDARHFRVFGADSMFGSVLARLGLDNAWTGGTRFAFSAPVPLERLADRPEARIVLAAEVPAVAERGLRHSVLWNGLAPVAAGRVHRLGGVNAFGGVPSGLRFAQLLAAALAPGAGPHG